LDNFHIYFPRINYNYRKSERVLWRNREIYRETNFNIQRGAFFVGTNTHGWVERPYPLNYIYGEEGVDYNVYQKRRGCLKKTLSFTIPYKKVIEQECYMRATRIIQTFYRQKDTHERDKNITF